MAGKSIVSRGAKLGDGTRSQLDVLATGWLRETVHRSSSTSLALRVCLTQRAERSIHREESSLA